MTCVRDIVNVQVWPVGHVGWDRAYPGMVLTDRVCPSCGSLSYEKVEKPDVSDYAVMYCSGEPRHLWGER